MSISIEALRKLLARPSAEDTANALKAWRAQEGFSQTEAAIRLGVSVRTLQGWEIGRPMPYPTLLRSGVNIEARAAHPHTLAQSDFPRELAQFIDLIGGSVIDKVLNKVSTKLQALSPGVRSLYGDRFFFHEQFIRLGRVDIHRSAIAAPAR